MTWATIRDGMKTRIDTITALVVFDTEPTGEINKDYVKILPGDPLLRPTAHNGAVEVNVRLEVRAFGGTVVAAQDSLDAYIWPSGANSIPAAVQADPTLGGAIDGISWTALERYEPVEGNNAQFQADLLFSGRILSV